LAAVSGNLAGDIADKTVRFVLKVEAIHWR